MPLHLNIATEGVRAGHRILAVLGIRGTSTSAEHIIFVEVGIVKAAPLGLRINKLRHTGASTRTVQSSVVTHIASSSKIGKTSPLLVTAHESETSVNLKKGQVENVTVTKPSNDIEINK